MWLSDGQRATVLTLKSNLPFTGMLVAINRCGKCPFWPLFGPFLISHIVVGEDNYWNGWKWNSFALIMWLFARLICESVGRKGLPKLRHCVDKSDVINLGRVCDRCCVHCRNIGQVTLCCYEQLLKLYSTYLILLSTLCTFYILYLIIPNIQLTHRVVQLNID